MRRRLAQLVGRFVRMSPLVLVLAALSLSGASSCVTTGSVADKRDEIMASLNGVRGPAMICKPRELAEAEANLVFATDEAAQGQSIRAWVHVDEAERLWQDILSIASDPKCEGDRDGDGLRDSIDKCPDEPEDFDGDRDDDGCPEFDRDGDGIDDPVDKCPDDPEDMDAFEDEDGCPEADNDKDGILDAQDKCPIDPEDMDGFQDEDGCPEADDDRDGDGIIDSKDKCPLQPEDKDGDEDEDGCPEEDQVVAQPAPAPVEYKLITVKDDKIELKQKVFFKTARATIMPKSFDMLNEIADVMRKRKTMQVRIEGHTDSKGGARGNKRLSQKRADSVKKFLKEAGVDASRMESVGFGEDKPIDSNRTRDGRANNRRVEFVITKQ